MGGRSTETEIKIQLRDEASWQALCQLLGTPASEIVQHNHFFDTADGALGRQQLTLRVRDEGDRAWITVKGAKRRIGDAVVRLEDEAALDIEVWRAVQRGEQRLEQIAAPPLTALGRQVALDGLTQLVEFENLRRGYRWSVAGRPLLLEVDRTRFADGAVDHEIEVELDDADDGELLAAVTTGLRALLDRIGQPYLVQPRGKFSRALQHRG